MKESENNRYILIGSRLKELRDMKKYTQKYVAEIIGVKSNTYSEYESGKRKISIDVTIKLSELYQLPIDYIVLPDKWSVHNFENIIQILGWDCEKLLSDISPYGKAKDDVLPLLSKINLLLGSMPKMINKVNMGDNYDT